MFREQKDAAELSNNGNGLGLRKMLFERLTNQAKDVLSQLPEVREQKLQKIKIRQKEEKNGNYTLSGR
jgi:hypothetical protein